MIKPDAVMEYRKETHRRRLESKKKISLPIESKAEDTLQTLSRDTSDIMSSDSLSNAALDGSGSDDSVVSGPSSPSAALYSLRCRGCKRLFNKMKKQEPPRKNRRDTNPASLSCDEWLLKKPWQPQRQRQAIGRLWVHLKRIRLQAANHSDDRMPNKAWERCPRPHVFLQRNLRRCKKWFEKASGGTAKPLPRRRRRAKSAQLLHSEKFQRRKKRKSTGADDTSEHLSISSDLIVNVEPDEQLKHGVSRKGVLQQLEKVSKKRSVSGASVLIDTQANDGGLERTRRVLKFDTYPNDVLLEEAHKKCLFVQSAGEKLNEDHSELTVNRLNNTALGTSDVFRTPTDQNSTDLRIFRKSGPLRPFQAPKNSFRTMLAALGQGHNQIIKESHDISHGL